MYMNLTCSENLLAEDIERLDRKMTKSGRPKPGDLRSKCTHAYLKQLMKDKRESLAMVRFQRAQSRN